MKISDINGSVSLANGVKMPYLGLGVFEAEQGNETVQAIHWALEAGYRHIDTAALYGNEESVGKAIQTSGIPREEIFVTTKVWNSDQGFHSTLDAFSHSLEKLKLDYVDLYLVHWPVRDKYVYTWEALEELYAGKLVRAIGVSNFLRHQLERLINRKGMLPMVNQVEFHPYLVQPQLHKFCRKNSIQYQAWTPIMKGQVNEIPLLQELGRKYSKTPVQITLRWDLQKGVVTIPKSVRKERIIENASIFDFELTPEEVKAIDGLDRHSRIGADPDNFNF
ncbi:MAG: aldo/keto reductase [Bacteroidales bacterium]|nr:aldo/keto reductase [Bacteroidales bacterium]